MGTLLVIVGVLLAIGGNIAIIVAAFRESVLWGIGCLLIPIVGLIFVILHWSENWKPFACSCVGTVLWLAGAAMSSPNY